MFTEPLYGSRVFVVPLFPKSIGPLMTLIWVREALQITVSQLSDIDLLTGEHMLHVTCVFSLILSDILRM